MAFYSFLDVVVTTVETDGTVAGAGHKASERVPPGTCAWLSLDGLEEILRGRYEWVVAEEGASPLAKRRGMTREGADRPTADGTADEEQLSLAELSQAVRLLHDSPPAHAERHAHGAEAHVDVFDIGDAVEDVR